MATEQETPTGVVTLARANEIAGTGHLWIYAGFVHAVRGQPVTGDLVDVVMPSGRFYARGLYNPASKIRIRILTFQEEPITPAFWRERIAQAVRLRTRIASETTAYRLIYGEADRLPGLIVDRYDDVLVMQTLSSGMDRRKEMLADLLCEATASARVYLRNDAKSRLLEGLSPVTGFLRGDGGTTIEVREGAARFLVDIARGQKTGWFCDQRENRLAAARLTAGKQVLEVFCHTGAFGIQAALAGASHVEGLDVSEEALILAREHARLNGVQERCSYRAADAFEELRRLEQSGRQFDVVLLDPPAFARSKQAVPRALSGYKDINLLGIRLTKPEGIVVTSSCSHHVSDADLWKAVGRAAQDAKRSVRLLEQRGQASDHPILATMPETRYLKCFIMQVL
ncbi:MAG TPA: class I SAM-dependent rRNA methyltransferase [Nitrospira sp.]|nr:class I SAM-dependent rRNA methyltransferase [Nitrospira sp.]